MSEVAYPTEELLPPGTLDRIVPVRRRNFLRSVARRALDYIRDRWPVETAYSLSRWGMSSDGTTVYNDADYASFVHIQEQYGGPPGLAERLWRQLRAGAIRGEIDRLIADVLVSQPGQGDALAIFQRRLAERRAQTGTLREAAIRAGQGGRLRVAGAATSFDPIALASGGLAVAPSGALAVSVAGVPVVVPVARRAALVATVRRLWFAVPIDVIQRLERGDARGAIDRLVQLGRADVARELAREAR